MHRDIVQIPVREYFFLSNDEWLELIGLLKGKVAKKVHRPVDDAVVKDVVAEALYAVVKRMTRDTTTIADIPLLNYLLTAAKHVTYAAARQAGRAPVRFSEMSKRSINKHPIPSSKHLTTLREIFNLCSPELLEEVSRWRECRRNSPVPNAVSKQASRRKARLLDEMRRAQKALGTSLRLPYTKGRNSSKGLSCDQTADE